jgi:hypothetical protein
VEAAANTAWALEKGRLYRRHRDALKAVEEWRVSLGLMNERERQRTQRGRLMAAIQEVQECALNRRLIYLALRLLCTRQQLFVLALD